MAIVEDLTTDEATLDLMKLALKIRELIIGTSVEKKKTVYSREQLDVLIEQSQLDPLSLLWEVQGDDVKSNYSTAAGYSNLTGYQLFVQEVTYRLINGIEGIRKVFNAWQYKVWQITVDEASPEFYVWQEHPTEYYLRTKVPGTKNTYQWVYTEEYPEPDILVEFSYYNDFQYADDPDFFDWYLYVEGIRDGQDDADYFTYDLDVKADWAQVSELVETGFEEIYYYEFGIEQYPLYGKMWMDNLRLVHTSQNWAFDSRCELVGTRIIDYGDGPDFGWVLDADYDLVLLASIYVP